jgi:hypothetical protein
MVEENWVVHELAIDGTGSTEILQYSAAMLGVYQVNAAPNLSPDGLRMVFVGEIDAADTAGHVFYSDRPDLTSPFRSAELLQGVPPVSDPFMSEDCSRLYFSAVQSVLYLPQR